jgi:hypothetical protein
MDFFKKSSVILVNLFAYSQYNNFRKCHEAKKIILIIVFVIMCGLIRNNLHYTPATLKRSDLDTAELLPATLKRSDPNTAELLPATLKRSDPDTAGLLQAAQNGIPLLRPQESFSSIECKGYGDQSSLNNDTSTTCLFSNVLYKDGVLTIYEDPVYSLGHLTSDIKSTAIPEHFLAMGSGPISAHSPNTWLKTRVLPSTQFPQTVIYEKVSLNVLYDFFVPHNQGHFMFDEVFAIFQSLLEMGLYGLDPQIVTLRRHNGQIYSKMYQERMHAITSKVVISLDEEAGSKTSALSKRYKIQGIMFQNVLIGVSQYSYGMRDPRRKSYAWQLFRHIYLTNLRLPTGPAKQQQITVIVKHGNRRMTNADNVTLALKKLGVPVVQIHGGKISHAQELEVLTKTTVLLTPPGGVSMLSAFLPRTSVAIIIDVYLAKGRSVPYEAWWWDIIKPFHFIPYHLESNEVLLPEILDKNKGPLTEEMRELYSSLKNQTYADLETLPSVLQHELWINFVNTRLSEKKVMQIVSKALARVERTMKWNSSFASV